MWWWRMAWWRRWWVVLNVLRHLLFFTKYVVDEAGIIIEQRLWEFIGWELCFFILAASKNLYSRVEQLLVSWVSVNSRRQHYIMVYYLSLRVIVILLIRVHI